MKAGRREWIGLAVLALPSLLVSIDVFVLLLALPQITTDLGASATQQLWIMDSYGFLLSGFLVTMGTLGDRIGRRKLLLIGAGAFTAASVLAAFAPTPGLLIAARALLGVAGATLAPSTLALISNMFRDARQRALAISVWMVCFLAGAAIGPLVGGVVLAHFWWGAVFLLCVPVMLLLLVAGPVLLPEYRSPGSGRLDLASVALSLAAILPAVYGLKELAKHGWQVVPVVLLALGVAFGFVFVRRQRVLPEPLLDLALFAGRAFRTALGNMLFGTMLMGAIMVFTTQYLQLVGGLTPLQAGLWMLPGVVASVASSLLSPLLARRFRPAYVIGIGLVVAVFGLVLVASASSVAAVAVGLTVINLGAGPMVVLGTDLIIGSAPPSKAGSAASLNETCGELGFALGIALLGSLGTAVYRAGVEVPAGVAAPDSLASAVALAERLPIQVGTELLVSAREAFTTGMHVAAWVSAVLMAAVAAFVVPLLRHVRPSDELVETAS